MIRHTFLPLLMVVISFLSTLFLTFLGATPWSWSLLFTPLMLVFVCFVYSVLLTHKYQLEEAREHLKRLSRILDDFEDVAFRSERQEKDIRMITLIQSPTRTGPYGLSIDGQLIGSRREMIRVADDLIEAWFDEFRIRVELLDRNPRLLGKDELSDLVHGFKRLIFQHYDTVIERSISFITEFCQEEKRPVEKFEEFKFRYNGFVEKLKSFERDLSGVGYRIDSGFDLRIVSKQLK